jgi:hypothetical protein
MCLGPGLDSGRVERWGENASGGAQRIRAWMCAVEERDELERSIDLGDHRSRLSTKLGNAARTVDLGSGRSERPFGWTEALGHGALLAGHMLPFEAQRGPDDGVELEEEEQGQNQTHFVQ